MGVALACAIMLPVFSMMAQDVYQVNKVYLIGQLTNEHNGAPLKGHAVTIVSDTANEPGFMYYNTVITDAEGFYYDTIYTTLQKGALTVKTSDYLQAEYDTILHYRFKWSENNTLIANFNLTSETTSLIQANFSYTRNPSGSNNLEYAFSDLTLAGNIQSWNWDFGDGGHADIKNPTHIFMEPGLYKVSLTVALLTSAFGDPITTTLVKIINVTTKSYYHMGGHVFAGSFPIDKSEVFLYKVEGSEYVPIDTAIFNDTLGYFLFYQLIEGDYILKADLHPASQLFNMFMTTYYSDKLHWDEADIIYHHATNFEYDINLVPNIQASSTGWGKISGDIKYDASYGGGKSGPAENVSIILFDEYDQPMNICHSDENGDFLLDELDIQLYYVYAEVTGKITYPVEVVLEESSDGSTLVHIVIDQETVSGEVSSAIGENLLQRAMGLVYPNPAKDVAIVELNDEGSGYLSYSILSYTGQVIYSSGISTTLGSTRVQIDVSALPAGMYFIRFTDPMNHSATRKFTKH